MTIAELVIAALQGLMLLTMFGAAIGIAVAKK